MPIDLSGPTTRASLHTHTTHSDGQFPLPEVLQAYKELHFGAVAITDHNVWHDHSPASTDALMVLSANEPSLGSREHMLAIGPMASAPTDQGERPAARMQEVIDWTLARGGFAVLNHPSWTGMSVERLLELQRYEALEIFNGGCIGHASEYSLTHWDELLRRGRRVWGVATDDSHSVWDRGLGWVEVFGARDPQPLVQALKAGRFYSSMGPRIDRIAFDGERLTVKCEPVMGIAVMSEQGPVKVVHGKGGSVDALEWTLPKAHFAFLRVEIHRADGKKAWSNPVHFE